jgi:hypothetical protein
MVLLSGNPFTSDICEPSDQLTRPVGQRHVQPLLDPPGAKRLIDHQLAVAKDPDLGIEQPMLCKLFQHSDQPAVLGQIVGGLITVLWPEDF